MIIFLIHFLNFDYVIRDKRYRISQNIINELNTIEK